MNNGPISTYPFGLRVPDGDNRERHVCGDCGWIHYVNPKIVVGAVITWRGKYLLCKRAIEPRVGYWTMPAGYMEERETTEEGAKRESLEEANAHIRIDALLAVYNIPRISQVQMIYRAEMVNPTFSPGEESLEVDLYDWDQIPWDDLAFPSVLWALNQHREVDGRNDFAPHGVPPGDWGSFFRR
ncbi:MAG: NUDIX hydrolase [Alphaproteobacteria bacterium]